MFNSFNSYNSIFLNREFDHMVLIMSRQMINSIGLKVFKISLSTITMLVKEVGCIKRTWQSLLFTHSQTIHTCCWISQNWLYRNIKLEICASFSVMWSSYLINPYSEVSVLGNWQCIQEFIVCFVSCSVAA